MNGIWVVGDVHGCYKTLLELINRIPKGDKIVFTGDLVDRGNNSKEVVELVLDQYESVIGNHELMCVHNDLYWDRNGGINTKQSFGSHIDRLSKRMKEEMPLLRVYEFEEGIKPLLISHSMSNQYVESFMKEKDASVFEAVLKMNKTFSELKKDIQQQENILWSRKYDFTIEREFSNFNIFGHTPVEEPFINKSFALIDTGCVFGYKLSAIHYPTLEVISVESIE